ncbi:MAG: hypothetical protein Q9195_005942 [Heterodermia aff. obscurata]
MQVVQKRFHPRANKQAYEREVRNLCILSSKPHENIVPLLSAYIHGNSFNLLFPLITHGSLDNVFRSDVPSAWEIMKSEEALVMAIAGLASALASLHGFTFDNLHLAGSHRDIKPANILVDGQRLLLADFGLSRIVEDQQPSSSTAPNIAGDFIAPEYEDREFIRNPIGRASDIWAFGCVILMLLMFYNEGKAGLARLKAERRQDNPQYTHYCFHDYDRPNIGVEAIFNRIALDSSPLSQGLLFLVRQMLVIDTVTRLKASLVDKYLRSLAIYTRSTSVWEDYNKAYDRENSNISIFVERIRFQGWRSAAKVEVSDFPALSKTFAGASCSDFHTIMNHLQALRQFFSMQGSRTFLPIRARNDRLLETLDDARHTSAVAYADYVLLSSSKGWWLSNLQTISVEALDERTESKVAIRRQVLDHFKAPATSGGHFHVELSALEPLPQTGKASKVRFFSKTGPKKVPEIVLAEESSHFSRDTTKPAFSQNQDSTKVRLQETAELLTLSANNNLFKVLRCRGYYYDPLKLRSGLLYELPQNPLSNLRSTITLREILHSSDHQWLLGDRFRLAHSLALALFELHSVSWLHHNISASNVIFFYHEPEGITDPQSFFFIGFAQSRADNDLTESNGPALEFNEEDHYVHPEYMGRRHGFHAQYDYYAFGILLLEIAFWQIYSEFAPVTSPGCATTQSRINAITSLLPKVGVLMGQPYQQSVLACLDGTFSETSAGPGQKLPLLFRANVADRLSPEHCLAW